MCQTPTLARHVSTHHMCSYLCRYDTSLDTCYNTFWACVHNCKERKRGKRKCHMFVQSLFLLFFFSNFVSNDDHRREKQYNDDRKDENEYNHKDDENDRMWMTMNSTITMTLISFPFLMQATTTKRWFRGLLNTKTWLGNEKTK